MPLFNIREYIADNLTKLQAGFHETKKKKSNKKIGIEPQGEG